MALSELAQAVLVELDDHVPVQVSDQTDKMDEQIWFSNTKFLTINKSETQGYWSVGVNTYIESGSLTTDYSIKGPVTTVAPLLSLIIKSNAT